MNILSIIAPAMLIFVFIGGIVILNVAYYKLTKTADSRFHVTKQFPAAVNLENLTILHGDFSENPVSRSSNMLSGQTKFNHIMIGGRMQLIAVTDAPIDIDFQNSGKTVSVSSSSDVTLHKRINSPYIYARNIWALNTQIISVGIIAGFEEVEITAEEIRVGILLVGQRGEVCAERFSCRQISAPHILLRRPHGEKGAASDSQASRTAAKRFQDAVSHYAPSSVMKIPNNAFIDAPLICQHNLVAGDNVTFKAGLKVYGNLIAGDGCDFQGGVIVNGKAAIGKSSHFHSDLIAKSGLSAGDGTRFGKPMADSIHVVAQHIDLRGSAILCGTLTSTIQHGVRYV